MKIHCKFDELKDPKTLKNHPKNRNKHGQDQIDRLAEMFPYHGIRHPIIVSNQTGLICAGHGRKLAAIRAGLTEYPVVFQDFDSPDAEYAFLQADNAIALWAELDLSGINIDVPALGPDFNINMLGIKGFEPADKHIEGEDDVPENVPAVAQLGDIYQLGEHRLMCGDSTDLATVERLMDGEKADMVFTDPPYGMDLETDFQNIHTNATTGKNHKKVIGDDKKFDPSLLLSLSNEVFIWGADYFHDLLPTGGSWYCWDKTVGKFEGRIGNEFELLWSKTPHKRIVVRHEWVGYNGLQKEDLKKREHPNQKPVGVLLKVIDQFKHNNILDLFGGSGSTLIACEKTKRKCFMSELDPHYVDVIIARWEKFTGKSAELLCDAAAQQGDLGDPGLESNV